jgi:hypothetical protein
MRRAPSASSGLRSGCSGSGGLICRRIESAPADCTDPPALNAAAVYDPGITDSSPQHGPGDQLPALRASDAEREQTAEILRGAASEGRLEVEELEDRLGSVYTVRTRTELERLIADVDPQRLGQGRAIATPGQRGGLTVREGPGGDRWVISIMSGHERKGRWRVGPRCTVFNFCGGSEIDLNDAELADPLTELNVYSIMGGAEVRVPHGVEVQVTNFALMGGNGVELGDEITPVGGPVIRIRMISVMGGTGLKRGRKLSKKERNEQERLEAKQPPR